MYIIVGLGNPKREYMHTRHNVGFDVIDRIADKYNISGEYRKHKALCLRGYIGGEKVILAKPQTYMNLSGESVRELVDYYKIDAEEQLIVICDDVCLDTGRLRLRRKGSAGGHNGIKNIISHLGGNTFKRIKIGVGEKPSKYDMVDYVLGRFCDEEKEIMQQGFEAAAEAVKVIMEDGMDAAMNRFNSAKKE